MLVQAALGKDMTKETAKSFAYKALLADTIPQSVNI